MRTLTESEYQVEAQPKLRQIFAYDDAFTKLFAPDIPEKLIIAPYKYVIEPPLTNAVVAAASELGETGCYFSILWRWKDPQAKEAAQPSHWYIPLTEFHRAYVGNENYPPLITNEFPYFQMLEGAIYSSCGKWGIIVTHEWFGLLGGTSRFVEIIRSQIPHIDEQVFEFLNYVKSCKESSASQTKLEWVRPLLTQIYGEEYVNSLLIRSGLARCKKKGLKFLI
ncbi:hypothetical protein [Nodularia sp. NIES-3585]|uniref:hypothetical protein n=1 Tax=Nodularia sp. NIES-3585 TaxID=1973477 RepID=UPI000B5C5D81|nr:hypothetical protein [Nodularia sp. NIES-3585]GAX35992.1 hypothetical protein NIES3585_20120 [Nodularia sp. NIES-3585]